MSENDEVQGLRKLVTVAPDRTLFEAEKEVMRLNQLIDVMKQQDTRTAEEKPYIILLTFNDDTRDYEFKTGRTEAYEYIKGMIEEIKIHESKIIVDNVPLDDLASVYSFMKYVETFYEDSFDIEDYNSGEEA